jgi:hypothetical protein
VLEHHAGADLGRLEAHLDLGDVTAVVDEVVEQQPLPRLPRLDAAEVEALTRLLVPHLDPPSADAGLETDRNRTVRVLPTVGAALVPRVDLLGEHLERGDGIDGNLDARRDGVSRAHRAPPLFLLRRSA